MFSLTVVNEHLSIEVQGVCDGWYDMDCPATKCTEVAYKNHSSVLHQYVHDLHLIVMLRRLFLVLWVASKLLI